MARDYFSDRCGNCGGVLQVGRMVCRDCDLMMEGHIELPRLARLAGEDREFIELFVLSAGSLKEVGRLLGLSYPTVRARLDRVIENLRGLDAARRERRLEVIRQLERGEMSVEAAARELARAEGDPNGKGEAAQ